MKRLFMIAAAAIALVGCGPDYVVKGTLEGYTGEISLMANKSNESFGSVETQDGSFAIEVDTKAPLFANLIVGDKKLVVFVEPGEVVVNGSMDNWGGVVVGGTPANDNMATFKSEAQRIMSAYMSATTPEDRSKVEAEYDALHIDTYEQNKDNILGLYLLATQLYYNMTPDDILAAVEALPKSLRGSHTAITLTNHAEGIKRVDVGQKYIDLELPDKDGNMIKLSDVLAANKYVLLDFWASWCGPCMGEVPYLVADYAEYHDKGFEIYGVSLDRDREPWVKTMDAKALVWPNVSELQYWNDPSAKKYAVRSIPSNFLISSDGTIVARNLRGEELGKRLAELLGE